LRLVRAGMPLNGETRGRRHFPGSAGVEVFDPGPNRDEKADFDPMV